MIKNPWVNTYPWIFIMCVGHDTNLTGSIPVAGIYSPSEVEWQVVDSNVKDEGSQ